MGNGPGRGVPRARLSAPRLPAAAVPRDRVLQLLTSEVPGGADVTLVCAPAGYGKTTLLASAADWYRTCGRRVAWITCDADDDPTTFWTTVLAALEHAAGQKATGSRAWSHFRPPAQPGTTCSSRGCSWRWRTCPKAQ